MDEKLFAIVYDWGDGIFIGGHEEIFVRGFEAAKKKAQDITTERLILNVDVYNAYFDDDGVLKANLPTSVWSWAY